MFKRNILSRIEQTDEQKQKQHAAWNAWRVRNAKKKGSLVDESNYIDIPENKEELILEERARKIVEVKLQQDLKAEKIEQIRLKRATYLESIGQAVEE